MRISPDRIWPYPVFSEATQHYNCKGLSAEINLEYDSDTASITIIPVIDDDEIVSLIENGDCGLYCHVECSSTKYRELFELEYNREKTEYQISIPTYRLNDTIEIMCAIVTKKDIVEFTDDNLGDLYEGENITFPMYAIIGYSDTAEYEIVKRINIDGEIPSIFAISKSETANCVTYENSGDQIVIYLPSEQYKIYFDYVGQGKRVKQMMLIFPVLVDLINDIQHDSDGMIPQDKIWYTVLNEAFKKQGYSGMDDSNFISGDSVKLAQNLLGEICKDAFDEFDKMNQERTN